MSSTGQKNKVTDIKKTSTLENKHRLKVKEFETEKDSLEDLQIQLSNLSTEIIELDKVREIVEVTNLKCIFLKDAREDIIKKRFDLIRKIMKEKEYI